jgi:hypothetical protein
MVLDTFMILRLFSSHIIHTISLNGRHLEDWDANLMPSDCLKSSFASV